MANGFEEEGGYGRYEEWKEKAGEKMRKKEISCRLKVK
jgi:hypothetical protein